MNYESFDYIWFVSAGCIAPCHILVSIITMVVTWLVIDKGILYFITRMIYTYENLTLHVTLFYFPNCSWPGHATLEFFVIKNRKTSQFYNYTEIGF